MDVSNLYLGQGISFPLSITDGASTLDSYEKLIDSSIRMILGWEFGSRFFAPSFGSKLWQTLGMPNDAITLALVKRYTIDALSTWERRITLLDITIDMPTAYQINLILKYSINVINSVSVTNFQYIG